MDKDQEPDISSQKASEDTAQSEWATTSRNTDLETTSTSSLMEPSIKVCLIIFTMVELEKSLMSTQDQSELLLKNKSNREKLPRKSMSELSTSDTPIPDWLSSKESDKMISKNKKHSTFYLGLTWQHLQILPKTSKTFPASLVVKLYTLKIIKLHFLELQQL